MNAHQALEAAAEHLGLDLGEVTNLGNQGGPRQRSTFSAPGLSKREIDAELFYLPFTAFDIRVVWNFQAETPDGRDRSPG